MIEAKTREIPAGPTLQFLRNSRLPLNATLALHANALRDVTFLSQSLSGRSREISWIRMRKDAKRYYKIFQKTPPRCAQRIYSSHGCRCTQHAEDLLLSRLQKQRYMHQCILALRADSLVSRKQSLDGEEVIKLVPR